MNFELQVVAQLGLFKYSSMHIRRNELQYKFTRLDSGTVLGNVAPLFQPKEPLYVATDETDEHYLDAMRKTHEVRRAPVLSGLGTRCSEVRSV